MYNLLFLSDTFMFYRKKERFDKNRMKSRDNYVIAISNSIRKRLKSTECEWSKLKA